MFNAVSKLYFTVAGLAIVLGFGYVVLTGDRAGFTDLVFAGVATFGLGVAAYVFVPREPLSLSLEEASPRPADTTDVPAPSGWPLLAALSAGLVAAGAAIEPSLIAVGAIVGVLCAFAWFAQVWREHPSWTEAMTDRLNDRFVVPFALPASIFVLAGIGVISVSRLFLAVPAKVAPFIGATVAFSLLGIFHLLSSRQIARPAMTGLASIAVALVLTAGVAGALRGEREFEAHGEEGAFTLAADGLEFDKSELDLPAATKVTLVFANHESTPHNVAIYDSKGGTALFTGDIITDDEIDYELTTPEAGAYYFQCDVHPDAMNGTVVVSEEASEAVETGENVTTTSAANAP